MVRNKMVFKQKKRNFFQNFPLVSLDMLKINNHIFFQFEQYTFQK